MSDNQNTRPPQMANPFGGGAFESMGFTEEPNQQNLPAASQGWMPPVGGGKSDQAMAQIITAQRVAVKRDIPSIMQKIKSLALAAGPAYYYSIPFKNRRKGTTEHVEGPTIKLAVDLAREYGNCTAEAFPAKETPTHWVFLARFIDFETGFTYTRSFQQRKGQNTGMSDGGRAEDLVFQVGQSKAIRNVVCGALATYADEMFQAAKSGLLSRIENKPENARKWLARQFDEMKVPVVWVERVVGRTIDKWTARDMAQLYGQVNGVHDGFINAADIWPDPATVDSETGEVIEAKPAAAKSAKASTTGGSKKPQQQKEEKKDAQTDSGGAGAEAPATKPDGAVAPGGGEGQPPAGAVPAGADAGQGAGTQAAGGDDGSAAGPTTEAAGPEEEGRAEEGDPGPKAEAGPEDGPAQASGPGQDSGEEGGEDDEDLNFGD